MKGAKMICWWYIYVLLFVFHLFARTCKSVGLTEYESCTGQLRVCQDGEDPWHNDPLKPKRFCSDNQLDRPTIILTGASWWTSVYNMWIAQVILEEQLQVPVKIENINGGSTQFYQYDPTKLDVLDERVYSWDALHLASNGSMDCSVGFRSVYATVPDDLVAEGCTQPSQDGKTKTKAECSPCAHAMLEVWPRDQEDVYYKYISQLQTIEDGGALGSIGEFGWWATKSTLDAYPLLSSFRGMKSNDTSMFKRALTFGEFCSRYYIQWDYIVADSNPFALNATNPAHFCHHFFEYAMLEETQMTWTAQNNETYTLARLDMVNRCRYNTNTNENMYFYQICGQFWVVSEDIQRLLPEAETQLIRRGYYNNMLYDGLFISDTGDDKGILHSTSGCGSEIMDSSPFTDTGKVWRYKDGFTRFRNYDVDLVKDLNLRPINMRNAVRDVHEVSARLGEPILISWYRPSSIFLRHLYTLEDKSWGNITGSKLQLGKVQLEDYEEGCQETRRSFDDRCSATYNNSEVDKRCGYDRQTIFKAFASKLKDYAPEGYFFLRRFRMSRDQQEELLAWYDYDLDYRKLAPTDRRRKVVCDWVKKNKAIWENWLPKTAKKIRCLGESGTDIFSFFDTGQKIVECSGHGTCEAIDLDIHPNAGICKCEQGYVGDDCSGLIEPELLNIVYTETRFFILAGLQFVTVVAIWLALRILKHNETTSVVFRTSHPGFMRIILYASLAGCLGGLSWVGDSTVFHCMARPLFSAGPLIVINASIYVKLGRKKIRLAMNGEDLRDVLFPLGAALGVLYGAWFIFFTPVPIHVRLTDRVWLKYASCLYGSNLAAFEALLLSVSAFFLVMNCRISYELRKKPTYFNEGGDIQRTAWLYIILIPTGYILTQNVAVSPNEFAKFVSVEVTLLVGCWIALGSLIYPKYHIHYYEPERNNLKDGLYHPTGDPTLALGDPVLDMPRLLGVSDPTGTTKKMTATPKTSKPRSSMFRRLTTVFRRSSTKAIIAPVGEGKTLNEHEISHLAIAEARKNLNVFQDPKIEVEQDPKELFDPSKRSLAYRSPEMYLVMEKKLRLIAHENAELAKIIEEHRIDPVTGDMDEDFLDMLHRIESEHKRKFANAQRDYEEEKNAILEEQRQERSLLKRDKIEAVKKLKSDKKETVKAMLAERKAQEDKLVSIEADHRKLENMLRGTLPQLEVFLQLYGLQEYHQGLLDNGFNSTERLLLATKTDLKAAGMRTGHIRKLQKVLLSLESVTPIVAMPDGAVKAFLKPNNNEVDVDLEREVEWVRNEDHATGEIYLIHPITGETKWAEKDEDESQGIPSSRPASSQGTSRGDRSTHRASTPSTPTSPKKKKKWFSGKSK